MLPDVVKFPCFLFFLAHWLIWSVIGLPLNLWYYQIPIHCTCIQFATEKDFCFVECTWNIQLLVKRFCELMLLLFMIDLLHVVAYAWTIFALYVLTLCLCISYLENLWIVWIIFIQNAVKDILSHKMWIWHTCCCTIFCVLVFHTFVHNSFISQHWILQLSIIVIYRVQQKKYPQKFFAVFSATVWNFNSKFYSFISWRVLHLNAK